MREFAIINVNKDISIFENIINKIHVSDGNNHITVFNDFVYDGNTDANTEFVVIPESIRDSQSKVKNYVSKHYFDKGYKGFLHIIEDTVEIFSDPCKFIEEIEKMMMVLDQKTWYNTVTDIMNYTFKVYNPRFSVDIDKDDVKKVYEKKINWCSNANTSWVCYDYSKATYEDVALDESFKIPMYYIVKFLAERRNKKNPGELYYMNFYPSIDDERNVFRCIDYRSDKFSTTQEENVNENEIFTKMNINHAPDMSIESVMDDIYSILLKKSGNSEKPS